MLVAYKGKGSAIDTIIFSFSDLEKKALDHIKYYTFDNNKETLNEFILDIVTFYIDMNLTDANDFSYSILESFRMKEGEDHSLLFVISVKNVEDENELRNLVKKTINDTLVNISRSGVNVETKVELKTKGFHVKDVGICVSFKDYSDLDFNFESGNMTISFKSVYFKGDYLLENLSDNSIWDEIIDTKEKYLQSNEDKELEDIINEIFGDVDEELLDVDDEEEFVEYEYIYYTKNIEDILKVFRFLKNKGDLSGKLYYLDGYYYVVLSMKKDYDSYILEFLNASKRTSYFLDEHGKLLNDDLVKFVTTFDGGTE